MAKEILLQFSASVENGSHHPFLAKAIMSKAQTLKISVKPAEKS